jgi:hypothetical protein
MRRIGAVPLNVSLVRSRLWVEMQMPVWMWELTETQTTSSEGLSDITAIEVIIAWLAIAIVIVILEIMNG